METTSLMPSLDTWTAGFLLVAAQGFFLSFILFFHPKGNRQANLLLGIFIACFSLTLLEYVLHWTRYLWYFPNINSLYMSLVFVFGPLLYLYFRSIIQGSLKRLDSLHFIPAILFFINRLPYHLSPTEAFQQIMRGNTEMQHLISYPFFNIFPYHSYLFVGHLMLYAGIMFLYLRKSSVFVAGDGGLSIIQKRWFRTLFGLYTGFVLANLSYYLLVLTPYFSLQFDYQISLAMTIFIYCVGYLGYKQSEIFSGQSMSQLFAPAKYRNSSLTDAAAASLKKRLLHLITAEKSYRDNELRLAGLAEQLDTSPHHLSQLLNEHLGQSFSDFINHYRIEEAQELLLQAQHESTYIINIAYMVGFNNKTSFNKAFKNSTGLSPSQYRKQNKTKTSSSLK